MTDPETVAVFDCFSGIAGDMTLAALLDAGAPLDRVIAGLEQLSLPAFSIEPASVSRAGLSATYLRFDVAEERTFQPDEMIAIVATSGLPQRVIARSLEAISWLERGESAAHRTDQPHFHEVGGVDAVLDIVGVMLALESLNVGQAFCPVVTVGSGTITKSAHGAIPASPGPAAANILQAAGFAMRFVETTHELVTPTGAAILAAVAKPGAATITALSQGAGAGKFDPPNRPNALRVFIGTQGPAEMAPARQIVLLEANIDDMPATLLAHARDRLMEEGALDAWTEAIGMKKGRAATKLCALAPADKVDLFANVFLTETTTLGVRTTPYSRYEATRRIEEVTTSLGPVRVKISEWQGNRRRSLEWEDVRSLAAKHNLPALEVQRLVEREIRE